MNELNLDKFKKCQCGINVNDTDKVKVKYSYTWIGWFFWSMGTTAIPTQIGFTCTGCNTQFEVLKEKELIEYYIYYKRH